MQSGTKKKKCNQPSEVDSKKSETMDELSVIEPNQFSETEESEVNEFEMELEDLDDKIDMRHEQVVIKEFVDEIRSVESAIKQGNFMIRSPRGLLR